MAAEALGNDNSSSSSSPPSAFDLAYTGMLRWQQQLFVATHIAAAAAAAAALSKCALRW